MFFLALAKENWEKMYCSEWSSVFAFLRELFKGSPDFNISWTKSGDKFVLGWWLSPEISSWFLQKGIKSATWKCPSPGEPCSPQYCCLQKGREFRRVQLLPLCEPKLPLYLKHLGKSLCLAVGLTTDLGRGTRRSFCLSLSPSLHPESRSRELLRVYPKRDLKAQDSS